jgi:UDP-N-acetylglucosamine acyltransferase
VLGDKNQVREFASLSLGTAGGGMETVIGDENLFMNNSHVGHDCRIGSHTRLANGAALAGHVTVDDHAIVSGLAAVAQFVHIGESAFLGGGSMVVMDVPPYCMANGDRAKLIGLNVVGLERRGFSAQQMTKLKRGYRLLFQSKLLARDAVERIRAEIADSPQALAMADFVAASERGVTRP